MMNKNFQIALAAILVGTCAPVFAEEGMKKEGGKPGMHKGQHMSPEEKSKKMAEHLGLSADQQSKVKGILQEAWTKKQAATTHEQKKAIHMEMDQQILAVLNPEQQAKFKAKREHHKQKMEEHRQQKSEKMENKSQSEYKSKGSGY